MPELTPPSMQYPRAYVPDLTQPTRQLMVGPGHPPVMLRDSWLTALRTTGNPTPTT
jgi:hypothetical protein